MNQSEKNTGNRIAIFISYSGHGGVERMVNNLARGFLDAGFGVDLVMARTKGGHLDTIPNGVRQIRLETRHTFSALPGLATYLRREKPDALLAAKDRAIKVAILARMLSGYRGRLAGRIGTNVSESISGKGTFHKWAWRFGMRLFYPAVDRIVAVSEGVAEDIRSITNLPPERFIVICNPVITPELFSLSAEPFDHDWFKNTEIPVIIGIGRLTEQKDFPTLIKAFALVRKNRPCRLMILGEGGQRKQLEDQVRQLGLVDDVQLPGFVANPYAPLSRCAVFVLSSRWEGSPNALTEALALGVQSVSTNCPSGPEEILQGGRYGTLVPVGDQRELAEAIYRALADPLPPEALISAVRRFTVQESVKGYLDALELTD